MVRDFFFNFLVLSLVRVIILWVEVDATGLEIGLKVGEIGLGGSGCIIGEIVASSGGEVSIWPAGVEGGAEEGTAGPVELDRKAEPREVECGPKEAV